MKDSLLRRDIGLFVVAAVDGRHTKSLAAVAAAAAVVGGGAAGVVDGAAVDE